MKLAAKTMLVSIFAVIAVLAVSNFFTTHLAFERIKSDHQEYVKTMANELVGPIVDAWNKGGLKALNKELLPREQQKIARWVWFEETVTTSTKPCATADFSEVVEQRKVVSFVSTTDEGSRQLHTYYLVDLGESRAGGLEFTSGLEQHDRQARRDLSESLISIGTMALMSIAVVLIAGVRLIARPLEKLTDATRRIGKGDFSTRVELPGNDELSQLAKSINDMSERLEQQNQAIEIETAQKLNALKQLRHADRLKTVGRMAAGIAHQIGTPLSVVSGRAELIAQGNLSAEQVNKNATTIQGETEQISGMVRQLLDFARQAPTQKSAFDLNEIVTRTFDLLRPVADKQRVGAKFSLTAEPAMATVDSGQIQQVLTNIMMNAIQSMQNGGSLELGIKLHQTAFKSSTLEDYWVISILDQGCGISKDSLESIFEPFFTTKDVGQGTGLGLSIAHSIIQEHEGWIDVESDVGKGSRFQIFLPAANPFSS